MVMNTSVLPAAPQLLVIEDEADLRDALVIYLNLEGMVAHGVSSLAEADQWMAHHECDILLLDWSLPDGDGVEWLKARDDLARKGVIITTARSDNASRLSGVRAGADIYLVKPVLPEEIVSLVHNMMRRLRPPTAADWVLDAIQWQLLTPQGLPLKLTHSEHLLMHQLARASGQVVSREELAAALGHDPEIYDYRRMEVLVRRLRNKSVASCGQAIPLVTAHRQGYAFTASIRVAG